MDVVTHLHVFSTCPFHPFNGGINMGTYGISVEELYEAFNEFLQNQEGEVSAEAVAGAWNKIAEEQGWIDRLEAFDLED